MLILIALFIGITAIASAYALFLLLRRNNAGDRDAIRSSAGRYKEIFDNASDAIFVVEIKQQGRKFHFESMNPVAVQLLGSSERLLNGHPFDVLIRQTGDLILPGFLEELGLHLSRCIGSSLMSEYESNIGIATAGSVKIYRIKLIPMAEDGGITHVICFAQDISAQKRYEQELLERGKLEMRLSRFAASAPGFFYTYRHDVHSGSAMPFASAGIEALFGLHPEEVADGIVPLNMRIHPDDMQIIIEGFAKSARDMSLFNAEFRVNHPDKGELWVELNSMPIQEPDDSILWHGFMHDITGRKQMAEILQRNRESLEEAQRIGQMGSWNLDLNSGALTWSTEIFRIFEIDPAQFGASYAAFLEAIHPDDRAAVDKAYTDSLANRTPYCIDHRLLFADGRIKHVRECCESYFDENGKPLYSHGTVQDVTLLKETERQLNETQKKLRELSVSRESETERVRKRIAWEMHEDLGQLLAAAKMRMYGMRGKLPKDIPWLKEDSSVVVNLLDRSIEAVHDLVSDLRPTVLLHGISPALEWLSTEFEKQHGVACELRIGDNSEIVNDDLITLVFRVAQDSLNDIARYDGVSKVSITWKKQPDIGLLTIQHDGKDFTTEHSLHLFSVQERLGAYGGEMSVFSTLQGGSVIEAIIPYIDDNASLP